LVVEPLVVNAGAALGAKVTTGALAMTRANKMSRLGALHFNLAILKTNTHAKGTPGLPLANRAVGCEAVQYLAHDPGPLRGICLGPRLARPRRKLRKS